MPLSPDEQKALDALLKKQSDGNEDELHKKRVAWIDKQIEKDEKAEKEAKEKAEKEEKEKKEKAASKKRFL